MKKDDFIKILQDILEIEDKKISEETDLTTIDEFDSLAVLSIIAMVDEKFCAKLTGSDFQKITTVKSLIELIGNNYFEK